MHAQGLAEWRSWQPTFGTPQPRMAVSHSAPAKPGAQLHAPCPPLAPGALVQVAPFWHGLEAQNSGTAHVAPSQPCAHVHVLEAGLHVAPF